MENQLATTTAALLLLAATAACGGDNSDGNAATGFTTSSSGQGGSGSGGRSASGGSSSTGTTTGSTTGSGGSQSDAGPADRLCKFSACGGDVLGDWRIENNCIGATVGVCEARYPTLHAGGTLHFGCNGAFRGGFGSTITCPQADCDCSVTMSSDVVDGTYTVSGTSLRFQANGNAVTVDYCVDGDVLTFGQSVSGLAGGIYLTAYINWTARRDADSTSPHACPEGGPAEAGPLCIPTPDGGVADASFDTREQDPTPYCRELVGAPCAQPSDCLVNSCYMPTAAGGICTKACTSDAECGISPFGEHTLCIDVFQHGKRCYPVCTSDKQCTDRYGAAFACVIEPQARVCGPR